MSMNRVVVMLLAVSLTACVNAPPRTREDLCAIFQQKSAWYPKAKAAETRWNTPMPILMATMAQESSFVSDARTPRHYYLGFIPGPRASDAYGYAQAKNDVWHDYRQQAGGIGASRDDFGDAIDFVGWYYHQAESRAGIRRDDAYNLYLAYHEGIGAYMRRTTVPKSWQQQAQSVARRARQYSLQLQGCVDELEKAASSWF